MRKILLFILIFSFFFLSRSSLVFASEEFLTSYNVTYEASLDGKLQVTQEVSLTNKLSNIYATEYSFTLEKGQPQNIFASDEKGILAVTTKTEGDQTTISLRFNDQVVGKDKTLKFVLKYELSELLRHSGQIWELSLPKIANAADIDEYHLNLKVPLAFGKPAFISPDPISQKIEGETQIFVFEKESIGVAGVVAAFGEFQVFDFNLTYHLANPLDRPAKTKIALPPQTNYQKVSYGEINPLPANIEIDGDGNWLALYSLLPNENLEVRVSGQVKIFAQPQRDFLPTPVGDLNKYLQPQKYWEKDDPQIAQLAQKLKTPREIYDYVVQTLDYDYRRIQVGAKRLGALGALAAPDKAICMEFTDLFIALARAAGIPSRELDGFAYTQNPVLQPLSLVEDVLHAWPEYYDWEKKTWIQVDPTWQDTTGGIDYFSKLDVGHFVFAIHGESSQIPYPAGSYKIDRPRQKDVQVTFGQYKESAPSAIQVDFLLPSKVMAERQIEGQIKVANRGSEAIYNLKIEIGGQNLFFLSDKQIEISVLPPFAYQEIPFKAKIEKIFPQGNLKLVALGNNQKFEYNIAYESIVLNKILPILGGLLAAIVIAVIAKKTWRLYLQKRQGESDLCR